MKRTAGFLVLAVLFCFISGCGGATPEQAVIKEVNKDDKNFKGVWVYKAGLARQSDVMENARVEIVVDGKKFRLVRKSRRASTPDEECVYDGEVLWQLLPSQKQGNSLEIGRFEQGPFWKMPYKMKPFDPPQETGEHVVAGRKCKVLRTGGKYGKGDVTLTYWVDKEENVLLKKEHLLEAAGLMLAREIYECESIEFAPAVASGTFEVEIPQDWVQVKKQFLDCEILDTKF